MFVATSCLFCLQGHFSHAGPPVHVHGPPHLTRTSSSCSRSPSPLDVWRREAVTMGMALGDGLLQEVWFSDSSEDEGSPRKS